LLEWRTSSRNSVDRMKREFGVETNVGKPQVAYRETITGEASMEGKYIKQSGGRGNYGHVKIRIKPMDMTVDPKDYQRTQNVKKVLNSLIQLKEELFHKNISCL